MRRFLTDGLIHLCQFEIKPQIDVYNVLSKLYYLFMIKKVIYLYIYNLNVLTQLYIFDTIKFI